MDKPQFDVTLGGSVSISHDVEINKMISARASEISAMTYSVENPQRTKLVFQKLPVHMRRRVMSHNAKRMPRRLREAHQMQMEKSGLPPRAKRPSRKYRRRPHNLLLEYSRRKRTKKWLETHIWHAKRFHMCEKWGYKIPNFSNDRGFRASYRAVAKHCMMQDVSYYSCIELMGPEGVLIERLRAHCRDQLSFGARMYLTGSREGSLVFYKRDNCPVGVVHFFWRPRGEENLRTLWIWVHPALFDDVLHEISLDFGFTAAPGGQESMNSEESGCRVNLLRNYFNRFRLRGPLSIAVLSDTLKLPKSPGGEEKKSWNDVWYEESRSRSCFRLQGEFFEGIKTLNSPGQLPRGSVVALTVLDPRIFLPERRRKAVLSQEDCRRVLRVSEGVAESPLWEAAGRERVKGEFKTNNEINKLREGNLVPGVQNDGEIDEDIVAKVPVILVQCPGGTDGEKSVGFSSGIDIILPSRWGLAFWIAFMHRCARPIGLREYQSVIFENLMLNSPEVHHPDTLAYSKESLELKNELTEAYFRRPPNRRINFTKFSISSPFCCEWGILVREWTGGDAVKVLRSPGVLRALGSTLRDFSGDQRHRRRKNPSSRDPLKIDESLDRSCLVPVRIKILGKGRPKKFAVICTPSEEDLRTPKDPVESLKPDPLQKKRKLMTKSHKEALKRAMRRRSRLRKGGKLPEGGETPNVDVKEHAERMRALCLPECRGVRHSCDREVMGHLIQGDFCFTESTGVGWGYVVMESLVKLIERKTNVVLVRNVQSRQYRKARIDIIE
ncbi:ribonucleases P/MRP protein subunit POP1 [Diachasma alloeum]|uniref:ribonucleases P/MRP protein subunit POP1 n=1 Tax=Diachasma alloeum TaxID=454923 RepID=UPI00073839CD|nr:ribonucleases P/MRP protein subunit POP1 [Diachasma alloeum]